MGKTVKAVLASVTAITLAIIGIFASGADFTFDFSNTEIGQIGDNVINNYLANQGIDLEEFKRMCDSDEVHTQFQQYCKLV